MQAMLPELLRPQETSKLRRLKNAINVLDEFVLNGERKKTHPLEKVLNFSFADYYQREIPVKIKSKNYTLKVTTQPHALEKGHNLEISLLSKRGGEINSIYLPDWDHLYLLSGRLARLGLDRAVELLEIDVLPEVKKIIAKDKASK